MYRGEFDIGAEKKLSLNIEDTRCKWLGIFSVNLMVFMKLFAAAHLRGTFRPWLRFPFLRRMQCFSCFPMWVALASQFAYKHWHKDLFGCTILRINYTLHMTRYRYDNVLEMIDIRNSSDPGWPRVPRDSGSLKRSGEFSSPPTENMWLPFIEWKYWKLLMNHSLIKVLYSDVSSAQIKSLSVSAVIQLTKKWHVSNNTNHLVAHDKIAWPGHVDWIFQNIIALTLTTLKPCLKQTGVNPKTQVMK